MTGVHCGIKQDGSREDLTLICAEQPAVAAGVYTQNLVCAAPVLLDRQRTPSSSIRVVVVNSGNANACTGQRGADDALEMARQAAEACGARPEQALVMSTGIIGEYLPMAKVRAGIRDAAARLAGDEQGLLAAARGILTTDKSHKIACDSVQLTSGATVSIAGLAKGAGMIGPNMATMLAVLMTDAALEPTDAQRVLKAATDASFNCISVEGHTSTNDTVLLLASGAARKQPLVGDDLTAFSRVVEDVCIRLARQIPDDGEGASHLITIDVDGCSTRDEAMTIARTVASSALVKTGIAGNDPNWGRIVSAAGYSGVSFDPARLELYLNQTLLFAQGGPVAFDAQAVSRSMQEQREVHVRLVLDAGEASARCWTSDLTEAYVRLNADYHT
jgi:glutamate N-acetyltransferase/amino-acid N-acetyltransferase